MGRDMMPAEIRIIKKLATRIQERLDDVLKMDTEQRRKEYELSIMEFEHRFKGVNWRDWVSEKKERIL